MELTPTTRSWSRAAGLALSVALTGCSDASIGTLATGPVQRIEVEVDGPLSGLGSWRYYNGVRLLECDIRISAQAEGGSSGTSAEWLEGVVDLYDLRTGRYLGTDYMYAGEVADLWGARRIESGERLLSRSLRYTSYGPFRAHFLFRYSTGSETGRADHRFDCR